MWSWRLSWPEMFLLKWAWPYMLIYRYILSSQQSDVCDFHVHRRWECISYLDSKKLTFPAEQKLRSTVSDVSGVTAKAHDGCRSQGTFYNVCLSGCGIIQFGGGTVLTQLTEQRILLRVNKHLMLKLDVLFWDERGKAGLFLGDIVFKNRSNLIKSKCYHLIITT